MTSSPLHGVAVAVVTVSDRAAAGTRADATGPVLADACTTAGATVTTAVVPDAVDAITAALVDAVSGGARVVITTGGTGLGPRDVTPEATAPLLGRLLPGIPELLRQRDAGRTPLVALSRGIAGVIEAGTPSSRPSLVVNLPGSPAAVASACEVLPTVLAHALAQLDGGDHA